MNISTASKNIMNKIYNDYNHDEVIALIKQQDFLSIKNESGHTPLHAACSLGHIDLIKSIFQFFSSVIDVNVVNDDKITPLHLAAFKGHYEIAKILLNNGADISIVDNQGKTALHYIFGTDITMLKLLVDNGADINAQDKKGETAFHFVSSIETLKLYINYGLDINFQDNLGNTILYNACDNNKPDIAEFLISNNANINLQNNEGQMPFHYAFNINTLKLFMKSGIDINYPDNAGDTILHNACYGNKIDTVKFLIDNNVNVNSQNNYGTTPLHIACKNNHFKIAEILLSKYSDMTIKNIENLTPLDLATKYKHNDTIEVIKSYQILKNYKDLNKSINSSIVSKSFKKPKI